MGQIYLSEAIFIFAQILKSFSSAKSDQSVVQSCVGWGGQENASYAALNLLEQG